MHNRLGRADFKGVITLEPAAFDTPELEAYTWSHELQHLRHYDLPLCTLAILTFPVCPLLSLILVWSSELIADVRAVCDVGLCIADLAHERIRQMKSSGLMHKLTHPPYPLVRTIVKAVNHGS